MCKLNARVPYFIRCIKPNREKKAGVFDSTAVQEQLTYTGVMETTSIRQCGYPVRMLFTEFYDFYKVCTCACLCWCVPVSACSVCVLWCASRLVCKRCGGLDSQALSHHASEDEEVKCYKSACEALLKDIGLKDWAIGNSKV